MIIYPAIDIRRGQCVRLYQGNLASETIYSTSPYDVAREFLAQGASWLHMIDLDGASNPSACQSALIKTLLSSLPLQIQIGGGIRTEKQIDDYFAAGARRVIVGSLAISSPDMIVSCLEKYGVERIVLAFDVNFDDVTPYVMTHAWQKWSNQALFDVLARFVDLGVKHVLCTDITRDGALTGTNLSLYQTLISRFPTLNIQASGGVRELYDLHQLKNINVAGVIVGRALYEKKFALSEVLLC